MNDIFRDYLFSFFHPFEVQRDLRALRERRELENSAKVFRLVPQSSSSNELNGVGVSFTESLSISWILAAFKAFYSLLAVFLGLTVFELASDEAPSFLLASQNMQVIYSILLTMVLFPLYFWFYSRLWVNMIHFFCRLFEIKEGSREAAAEVVSNALTSHLFLIIPIFGEIVFYFGSLVYLYAGLRENLGLSFLQSLIVLVCPLLLFCGAFLLLLLSFAMLILSFI